MAKTQQSFARHAKYKGPKAIFDGPEVGFVKAHYAIEPLPEGYRDEEGNLRTGHHLLLRGGKPVRLIQVDLAPDDPDDGAEEYLVAGPNDPPQTDKGRLIELEPENVHAKGKSSA